MATQPSTLAVDVGGTGIKADVLDPKGQLLAERQRVATTYPMPPSRLVEVVTEMAGHLPPFDRVSVGFPGVVRTGRVLTAPHFVTRSGPGTKVVPDLVEKWTGFDLAGALGTALSKPVRVANDADLQGAAVIRGQGLELVVTLGTGVGTGLFYEGRLAPHLEIAHHPYRHDQTYNEQLGEAARRKIGNRRWNRRVARALTTLHDLILYDHVYIGGGNSARIKFDVGPDATIVDNDAGILGGIKLWETDSPLVTTERTQPQTRRAKSTAARSSSTRS